MNAPLVTCESDDIVAPELPNVAKGKAAAARRGSYKRSKSDDDFIDDPNSNDSLSSSASTDYEYNSGTGSASGSEYDGKESGDSSDGRDSVDYESGSEEEQDSDDYNIKKPPRALGWESD